MANLARQSRFEDYDRWRLLYDAPASEAARQAAGWRDLEVFRSAKDPNEVIIITDVDNIEAAVVYAESDEVRERQRISGLIETTMYFRAD